MTTNTEDAPSISERTIPAWNGRIKMRIKVAGSGPALVYLHPAQGPAWDPFLSWLSSHFTVYAPEFPGTSVGDPYAIHAVHSISDVVLVYEEVFRALGLEKPVLVGQSFGGMLAAEIAAAYPDLPSKVILLDPIGLWREELGVADWISPPAHELPALLFHDPDGAAARSVFALPEDLNVAAAVIASRVWALGCTAKFAWPIPDRGLRARLHRVKAPVQLIWGRNDRLIPVGYVEDWTGNVSDCSANIIEDCGHIPQVEKLEETADIVSRFLEL